jgi:hypothetical protein
MIVLIEVKIARDDYEDIYEERKSELLTSASSMEFLSLGTRTSINSGAT